MAASPPAPPLALGDSSSTVGWLRRLAEWSPPSFSSVSSSSSAIGSDDNGDDDTGDLLDVISVDSSDEEEDGPVVVPLEVLVKRDPSPTAGAAVGSSSRHDGGGVVKSELRAAAPHDAGFLVDLCSDDSDSDSGDATEARDAPTRNQRCDVTASSGAGAFTYELAADSDDTGDADGRRAGASGGRSMILRFKRRKVRHESADSGVASVGLYYGGGAEDVAAAALSSDSDTEAYASDSFDDADDASGDDADEGSDRSDGGDEEEADAAACVGDAGGGGSARPLPTFSRAQVDAIIRSDVKKLEAQKPWRFVYRCLEVPFEVDRSTDAFDLLFERWDAFWKTFGRAVWERYFWAPLPAGTLEYHRRKRRQWRAARTFRLLAVELCEKLGQGFLRQVARQAHNGWWYRSPPLVLRELFNLDRRKYGMYMTLYRERFPRGSRFERSLDASWCLSSVFLAESADCGVDVAHKAWQDVAPIDDDESDESDESEQPVRRVGVE